MKPAIVPIMIAIAIASNAYLLVKLRQLNSIINAATVTTPWKKYKPVIMMIKVKRSIINATLILISVLQRAAILYANAPRKPGIISTRKY